METYGSNYAIKFFGDNTIPNPSVNYNRNLGSFPFNGSGNIDQHFSVKNEKDVSYEQFEEYISISSSNRDSVNYPLHYDYRINFDTPYKNIRKVELISAIFPNQPASSSSGDILNESHLILDIDNLNYIEFPNNTGSKSLKGFSILPIKGTVKTSGGFIVPELGCIYHKAKVFKTPLASISYFNIKIRDYSGELYDFGEPVGSTNKALQNHFVFKITIEDVSKESLEQKNVY